MSDLRKRAAQQAQTGNYWAGKYLGLIDRLDAARGYDRSVLTQVLIYHWRRDDSGCGCGWGDRPEHLGQMWPEHVADAYEASAGEVLS